MVAVIAMFLCSFFLVMVEVAHPVRRMAETMEIPGGKLHKMEMRVPKGELTVMRDTYNGLVDRNEDLIRQINAEQKRKRKMELRLLEEQIKPHFLYNTINAMQYLCVTRKVDELYDSLEAMGKFYRLLLSKGKEVITLSEELDLVWNYIRLQNLRYGSIIQYEVDCDPGLMDLKVMKLFLQPLVENSIAHGIRPHHKEGTVSVEVRREGAYLDFFVFDDGEGIPEDILKKLQPDEIMNNPESFGIRGTIERIRTFYEGDVVYEIESEPGAGTKVHIRIPVLGGVEGEEEI